MGKGSCHKTLVLCLLLLWAWQRSPQELQVSDRGSTCPWWSSFHALHPTDKIYLVRAGFKAPLLQVKDARIFLTDLSSAFSQVLPTLKVLLARPSLTPARVQLCSHPWHAWHQGSSASWVCNSSADTPSVATASVLLWFSICYCFGVGNITTRHLDMCRMQSGNHRGFCVDFFWCEGRAPSQHLICCSRRGSACVWGCTHPLCYTKSDSTCFEILFNYVLSKKTD